MLKKAGVQITIMSYKGGGINLCTVAYMCQRYKERADVYIILEPETYVRVNQPNST